jgi:hypothetical protein
MSYGICRVQKVKSSGVKAMQYHNDRMPGEHSNSDIDHSRTHLNYELCRHGSYSREVQERIERYRESTRKVRKDAVVMVEGIVTASPEWFESHTEAEARAFFADAFEFVKGFMGEENVIHYTVHVDETTWHAHWGGTPIKDGQLSWKKFFDGRDALRSFQDAFYEQVSSRHGMERGECDTGRRHKDLQEMKRIAQREVSGLVMEYAEREEMLRELTEEITYRDGVLYEIEDAITSKEVELADLDRRAAETRAEIERETARLESLRLRAGALEEDVEQLGAVHALTAEYDRAPRGRKGEILSQIADCCIAVRDGIEARWRGVRDVLRRVLHPERQVPTTARIKEALRQREVGVDLASEARAMCEAASAQRPRGVSQARGTGAR